MARQKGRKPQPHDHNLENFHGDKNCALAVDVCEMTGVSGKERRRQDKQEGDEIDVQTAALWWRCVERHQGYYHFVKIVVEGAEKLSAKKCKEPSLFERADIFTVCHGALLIRFRVFVGEILQQCKSKTTVVSNDPRPCLRAAIYRKAESALKL